MKILSGCARAAAILLIILIVILLPATVLLNSVGSTLFNQEKMVKFIDQSFLDDDVIADVIMENLETVREDDEFDDEGMQNVLDSLSYLEHDDFEKLVNLILPDDIAKDLLDDYFSVLYDYLESDDDSIDDIVINLRPLKRNINNNSREIIEVLLAPLPECSSSQEDQAGDYEGDVEDLPVCRPEEEDYGYILDRAEEEIPELLEDMEDEFVMVEGSDIELDESVKSAFSTTKLVSGWLWVIPALMILLVIPLGARSIGGIFKWGGTPLFLAGLAVFLTALLVWLIFPAIVIPSMETTLQDIPDSVIPIIESFVKSVARTLGTPILITSIVLTVLGFLGLVIGFGLQFILKNRKDGDVAVSVPSAPAPRPAAPVQKPKPSIEKRPVQKLASEYATIVQDPVVEPDKAKPEKGAAADEATIVDEDLPTEFEDNATIVDDDSPKGMFG